MAKVSQPLRKTHCVDNRPPFECIALLLQGGGALGAYQAGVYEGLAEAGIHPDWVAGISIGAINAAIIAGNTPERRVEKLRGFWEAITVQNGWGTLAQAALPLSRDHRSRAVLNQVSAAAALVGGIPGFFSPRFPSPWLQPLGTVEATSYYDTAHLATTLGRFVDFDLINAGPMRFSVGAVNVRTGNFVYFDNTTHKIDARHVMASGALPPGFPPIEIDGASYWDGGLISNTPLQWVVNYGPRQDTLAFQVDLWSARGNFPRTIAEVATRQKEILYSSRTRENTDRFKDMQVLRHAAETLIESLPPALRDSPEAQALAAFGDRKVYSLVHLIYRAKRYEGDSKDYEFSRHSMEDHWRAGYHDTVRTLRHPESLARPSNSFGLSVFDIEMCGGE
jgi:NTE family protein